MNEQQKKEELLKLIDELCDQNFPKNKVNVDNWIGKLNSIYANNYRHTYSDIFSKIQQVLSEKSEVTEILGENLNVLFNKIQEKCSKSPEDANLKNTIYGFKKFSDHINLEIGRYNFIKNHFHGSNEPIVKHSTCQNMDVEDLKKKYEQLSDDVNKMRPITTTAQKALDGLDEKLENNKISSITTLTIFSAVVLAFSGGITFEAGVFQGIAEASPYRLVFTVALTGFILFNTIFALLYLVGKLSGKSISTRCKYWHKHDVQTGKTCGDGRCKKECASVNLACKIWHKYAYVFVINLVLLWVMYADFCLWILEGNVKDLRFIGLQFVPLLFVALWALFNRVASAMQMHRIKVWYKVKLLKNLLELDNEKRNTYAHFGVESLNRLEMDNLREVELYDKAIKNLKFKDALKKLDSLTTDELVSSHVLTMAIYSRQHQIDTIKFKKLKKELKKYLETKNNK